MKYDKNAPCTLKGSHNLEIRNYYSPFPLQNSSFPTCPITLSILCCLR